MYHVVLCLSFLPPCCCVCSSVVSSSDLFTSLPPPSVPVHVYTMRWWRRRRWQCVPQVSEYTLYTQIHRHIHTHISWWHTLLYITYCIPEAVMMMMMMITIVINCRSSWRRMACECENTYIKILCTLNPVSFCLTLCCLCVKSFGERKRSHEWKQK